MKRAPNRADDFMTRARGDIADGLQPRAAQAAGDGVIGAEGKYRKRADRLGLLAIGHDGAGRAARQRPRADRGACDGRADGKTLPGQRARELSQQRRLAAEQMGAAGDVEEQPMRRIERHQRREAVAPVGDIFQRLAIGGLVGVIDRQFGTNGAGIGERQADGETGTGSRFVDGIEHQRVVLFRDDDARKFIQPVVCRRALFYCVTASSLHAETRYPAQFA